MKHLWKYEITAVESSYKKYNWHTIFILMPLRFNNTAIVIHHFYIYLKHGTQMTKSFILNMFFSLN